MFLGGGVSGERYWQRNASELNEHLDDCVAQSVTYTQQFIFGDYLCETEICVFCPCRGALCAILDVGIGGFSAMGCEKVGRNHEKLNWLT